MRLMSSENFITADFAARTASIGFDRVDFLVEVLNPPLGKVIGWV